MTQVTVSLDDDTAARLEVRAQREGLSVAGLIEREALRIAGQDPFGFFGSGSSDELRGGNMKAQLSEAGFGEK